MDLYRYLDFRGMGISDRVPLRLPLLEMYVPLRARIEMPEGDTWAKELRLAGRRVGEEEAEAMGRKVSEPLAVLDLLGRHDGLIVLGDPAAGKTTFLKYLALTVATGDGESVGLGDRLPVLLPLSAYAAALEEVPVDRFLLRYHRGRGVGGVMEELLSQVLERGCALVLLDGLDEVRERSHRHRVVDRVKDFYSLHRGAGNKFVLTSRVVGYRGFPPRVFAADGGRNSEATAAGQRIRFPAAAAPTCGRRGGASPTLQDVLGSVGSHRVDCRQRLEMFEVGRVHQNRKADRH